MTNNAFESQTARPDNAYDTPLTTANLTREVMDLWARPSKTPDGNGESRDPDFLQCDEKPLQKGCEGPGKDRPLPPKDNDRQPKEPEQQPKDNDRQPKIESRKWPPVDPAWGTPHGQGREGREGRGAGREEGRAGRTERLEMLPALELTYRSGIEDTRRKSR